MPRKRSTRSSKNTKLKKPDSSKLCSIECKNPRSVTLPIRLYSEANIACHWTEPYKRKREARRLLRSVWNVSPIRNTKPPVEITFVRIAPRTLDYDNLLYAFKSIRDVVSDLMLPGLRPGQADGSDQLKFHYEQEKSKEYGIRIEVIPIK